ncbi:MAG: hypothetical protein AAGH15_16410, partial [Myxococcota bacterium]
MASWLRKLAALALALGGCEDAPPTLGGEEASRLAEADREELAYLASRLGIEASRIALTAPPDGSGHWVEIVGDRVARMQIQGASELHDLAWVGRFPELVQLRLVDVPLRSLRELAAPALRELRVAKTPLEGLAELAGAPGLETLMLLDVPLRSFRTLPALPGLRTLAAEGVVLDDLAGLDLPT